MKFEAHVSSIDLCLYQDVDCVQMQAHGHAYLHLCTMKYWCMQMYIFLFSETTEFVFLQCMWSSYWKRKFRTATTMVFGAMKLTIVGDSWHMIWDSLTELQGYHMIHRNHGEVEIHGSSWTQVSDSAYKAGLRSIQTWPSRNVPKWRYPKMDDHGKLEGNLLINQGISE